jgi:RNA polymerase sigma factor (sigma-70 family)
LARCWIWRTTWSGASRGEEALRLAADLQPDVILLDIAMPDMDGVEICRRLKSSMPNTAVLMLSAFDSEEAVTEALTAGASGYMVKTIDPQRMVEGIRTIARGEMLLSPTAADRVVQRLARTRREKEREADALQALTPREREVFHLVAQGYTNAEIAERLVLSEKTVKTHVRNISNKLNLAGKGEMRVLAAQLGLVPRE